MSFYAQRVQRLISALSDVDVTEAQLGLIVGSRFSFERREVPLKGEHCRANVGVVLVGRGVVERVTNGIEVLAKLDP